MQLSETRFQPGIQEILSAIARLLVAPLIAYGVGRVLPARSSQFTGISAAKCHAYRRQFCCIS